MNTPAPKPPSDAGTRFPFINLEKAIGRAKQLFDEDQKGREMTAAAAFGIWGYSEKSSGGFQTIAALKMYGLLRDANGGDNRKVALTPEALRYFRDERQEERAPLARQFAVRPKLINALWNEWFGSPPSDTIARSHLKAERGLSDQAARSLLAIYKENLSYVDLTADAMTLEKDTETDDDSSDLGVPAEVGDLVQVEIGGSLQLPKPARVRAVQALEGQTWVFVEGHEAGIPMEQVIVDQKAPREESKPFGKAPILPLEQEPPPRPGMRKEVFALDEGDVTLTFPENLSPTSFEDLDAYLKVFIGKMRRRANIQ